ncbi:MAG: hypothetical protein AAF149_17090 [Bacteroidota bacterium]
MIIGIGGCSRSGKSTIAVALADELQNSTILSLDNYAFPEKNLPVVHNRHDWEIPEAYNFDRLIAEIEKLKIDYSVVIVEGILVFYDVRLARMFHKRILMQIDKSTFLVRRKQEVRWGSEPDWFIEYVWSSFLKYGLPKDLGCYQLVNGKTQIDMNRLLSELSESN